MKQNPIQLKVKTKSLQSEAQIIRREESKKLTDARFCSGQVEDFADDPSKVNVIPALVERAVSGYEAYTLLNIHRKREVRRAARMTFLARAYLAGKDRKVVEASPFDTDQDHHKLMAAEAWRMIRSYGKDLRGDEETRFYDWVTS